MSLINKMLVDLEARKDGAAIVQPIYDDLRPAVGAKPAPGFARHRLALVAGVVGVFLATAYMLLRPEPAAVEPVAVAAKRATPTPPALIAAPAQTAPSAATQAPVTEPSAPAIVAAESTSTTQLAAATNAALAQAPAPQAPPAATTTSPAAVPTTETTSANAAAPLPVADVGAIDALKPQLAEVPAAPPKAANSAPAVVAATNDARTQTRVARATPTKIAPPTKPAMTGQADTEVKIEKTERVMTPRERALELQRTASAQRRRGDVHGAEASLRAALAHDANLIAARSDLVGLQIERGRMPEALALLHDGLTRTPSEYAFAQLAARLYVEQGNDAQALAVLEAGRAHAARDADYLGFLATLYQRAQRYADAGIAYDAALALRPQEARWWVGSGIVREAQGDTAGAEVAYTRAQGNPALPPTLARFVQERLSALKARAS